MVLILKIIVISVTVLIYALGYDNINKDNKIFLFINLELDNYILFEDIISFLLKIQINLFLAKSIFYYHSTHTYAIYIF